MSSKWIFCSLEKKHKRNNFDCGQEYEALNQFIKKHARQNQDKGTTKVYVVLPNDGSDVVAGYYTIGMSEIQQDSLPNTKGLPRKIPAMLIGRLAVDKNFQGQRLGELMLMKAFSQALKLSEEIGTFAVRVDAKDEKSKKFYLKYGFIPYVDQPLSLFIPIKTISSILQ